MSSSAPLPSSPVLDELAGSADDLHVLVYESGKSLREFLAGSLSYMPGWMRMLYRVRRCLVTLLGVSQNGIPESATIRPQDVSFAPGDKESIFTVIAAREDRFWLASAQDVMIEGYLGVFTEPLGQGRNRFHFVSGARFKSWKGRIYYRIITPFHHLVIRLMAREALR